MPRRRYFVAWRGKPGKGMGDLVENPRPQEAYTAIPRGDEIPRWNLLHERAEQR